MESASEADISTSRFSHSPLKDGSSAPTEELVKVWISGVLCVCVCSDCCIHVSASVVVVVVVYMVLTITCRCCSTLRQMWHGSLRLLWPKRERRYGYFLCVHDQIVTSACFAE